MFATTLADVARRTGYPVQEVVGWKTHTTHDAPNGLMAVRGIVCHHTAGAREGNYPSLETTVNGRSDLSGPLCNLGLGRDGTVYVIAAGKANHAGTVNDPDFQNGMSIGIEAENVGDGTDPWPDVQMRSFRALCRELMLEYKLDIEHVRGHKEVCEPAGRKIDPDFDMLAFRADIQQGDESSMGYSVTGDIAKLHPTLLRRLQNMANGERCNIYVQDGWRSMADAWKFWNAYQAGTGPVAAYPGTSLHMGNPPAYDPALAADITAQGYQYARTKFPRAVAAKYGLIDAVKTEGWHYECVEGRYPPASPPVPIGPVYKRGDSGSGVTQLQKDLNVAGVKGFTPLAVDGQFGPGTEACVRKFQENMGLHIDGIAGDGTLHSLHALIAARENRYHGKPVLKKGSTGPDVELVQRLCVLVGCPTAVDGVFGDGTEIAVKAAQKKWNIAADGIVGPQFWASADDVMDFLEALAKNQKK